MSQQDELGDLWDQFFRGSKYEWKWQRFSSLGEFESYKRALALEREADPLRAPAVNPFAACPTNR